MGKYEGLIYLPLQDFDTDIRLRNMTITFLEDLVCCPTLLPAEHKAASQLLRLLTKEEPPNPQEELANLLAPPSVSWGGPVSVCLILSSGNSPGV